MNEWALPPKLPLVGVKDDELVGTLPDVLPEFPYS
jgi:hypothetical protein